MSVYMDKRIILRDNEQLMNVSLGKLTNNLKCKDLFCYTFECFFENIQLMSRKGFYPYLLMKSFEKIAYKKNPR